MSCLAIADLERPAVREPRPAADDDDATLIDLLLAGLEGSAQGVALFDSGYRLVYCNGSARVTLGAAQRSAAWMDALRHVCQLGRRYLLEVQDGGRPRFAVLAPVEFNSRRWAFVMLGRDELCGTLELQMFASRHRLTLAESQVLHKLSLGLKPAEIATAHGVALSTVMTQVAALRAKTLSTSVRHLLCTLSRLPALRPVVATAA
jgi:DNA-binding CsgD family transcriptional regulator